MRLLLAIILSLGLAACSKNLAKHTLYPYTDNRATLAEQNIKNVMIATINLGIPSRHYLTTSEQYIDEQLSQYLKAHHINVIGNRAFEQQWKNAERSHGATYNNLTGQKTSAFEPALTQTINAIFTNYPSLDAIIFTDLIEIPIKYQQAAQRYAEWHGVRRRIKVEGIGEGVLSNFNWEQEVDAISLSVAIVNREQQLVFQSAGGIQVAQALILGTKSAEFNRRNDLLNNIKEIEQAIKIALHPVIPMKGYPKK